MNTDQLGGLIRSVLLAGGGYFVGKGIIDQSSMTQIVSALFMLGSTGWSLWANRSAKLAEPKKIL
jgi:hypothetical protein